MPIISNLNNKQSVGSPSQEYESMLVLWRRSRAIIGGEALAKEHDRFLDTLNYSNLLVPFSPKMLPEQYRWYVAEAELPGLVSQYSRVLVGGLLRKSPSVTLPETLPEEAISWIKNSFTEDGRSLNAFLDAAIWEELSTSRGVISIDFPIVENYAALSIEEKQSLRPFPVLWKAEEVINWQTGKDPRTRAPKLTRVTFRYLTKDYTTNVFHPKLVPTVADHYLNEEGFYEVQYYKKETATALDITNGQTTFSSIGAANFYADELWETIGDPVTPKVNGERLTQIPVFFVNGEVELEAPLLLPLVDREVALYNKVSRRNHLLYGASTYTPVIFSNMQDEEFRSIVDSGLGSWIKLAPDDSIDIFKTPTDALKDMESSIESGVSEMSRMGIRMLAPEGSASGVALEIRNAPQTAQLGVLNVKISHTFKQVINFMLWWKYGADHDYNLTDFTLSTDFDPSPLGVEWLRLVTEWYQARLIPRSTFIKIAKHHDILPSDYNDSLGLEEISQDSLTGAADKIIIEE